MATEQGKGLLWSILVVSIVALLVTSTISLRHAVSTDDVKQIVGAEVANIKVPTAAEIASQVQVPEPQVQAPASPLVQDVPSDSKLQDILEASYPTEVSDLKSAAEDDAQTEFEKHDWRLLSDWMQNNTENFDEVTDVDYKKTTVDVVALGLDQDADKVAIVTYKIKASYSLTEGPSEDFQKTVYVTSVVTYDKGDFNDENVEMSFSYSQ